MQTFDLICTFKLCTSEFCHTAARNVVLQSVSVDSQFLHVQAAVEMRICTAEPEIVDIPFEILDPCI